MQRTPSTALASDVSLPYLFFTFLKIGFTSFGGFMALVAVVQKLWVDIDKRLKEEDLLDAVTLASVLPGPVAVNVVAYVGYKLRGVAGSVLAFIAIILPSFLLVVGLSWLYFTYGRLPAVKSLFAGVLPAVTAIILSVAIGMAKKNVHTPVAAGLCVAAAAAVAFIGGFAVTLCVLAVAACIGGCLLYRPEVTDAPRLAGKKGMKKWVLPVLSAGACLILLIFGVPSLPSAGLHFQLFSVFSGLSLTLFGGGYVVIPALHELFVENLGWLTSAEFADGVAIGQVTPGPIFITAAFIGYKAAGISGAFVATVAFFTPPAVLIVAMSRFVSSIESSPRVKAMFRGIRPAVIGMIFASVFTIGKTVEPGVLPVVLFLAVLVLSVRYKISPVYLIGGAGISGILLF